MFRTHVPAARRLGLIALGLTLAIVSTSTTHTQAAPAPAAQAAANPFMFMSDGVIWQHYIKADQTAQFEMIVAKVKEALMKSDKPEWQEMAKGWKVYKASEAGPGMGAVYVSVIMPVAKGNDYTMSTILAQAFPAEANALYKQYIDAFATPPGSLLHLVAQLP